ncbi:hypothetical protein CRE_19844 [Caenorhabditis remanei]|uniref:Uncharacterized protein n=1 Tax=Caenorhabditis remanei TaxID=31234 RepID=E3MTM2_CAERE|nr:hypothetical protein CRE_19844 [Caenorhabditis remanei]
MSLDNISIYFDVEYLIKYLDLIFSIFGLVTNLIHLFVLSLKVSTIPNFIFLTLICGTDLLTLVTSGINQIWAVLTYIEHKNCIGYMDNVDAGFKFLSVWSQYISASAAPWITVVMAVTVIRNKKISWHDARRYAIFQKPYSSLTESLVSCEYRELVAARFLSSGNVRIINLSWILYLIFLEELDLEENKFRDRLIQLFLSQ